MVVVGRSVFSVEDAEDGGATVWTDRGLQRDQELTIERDDMYDILLVVSCEIVFDLYGPG